MPPPTIEYITISIMAVTRFIAIERASIFPYSFLPPTLRLHGQKNVIPCKAPTQLMVDHTAFDTGFSLCRVMDSAGHALVGGDTLG